MQWKIKTDIGIIRKENQDMAAVFSNDKATLAILCDGMGGHEGGSYASRLTIKAFEKEFSKKFPKAEKDLFSWFKNALKKSKLLMEKQAKGTPKLLDMGTTVTAVILYEKKAIIFNIGDSRTYVYNGLLHQVSVDHNLRNYYINEHNLSPEKAAHVMGGSALTSALGPKKKTKIDAFELDVDKETKYFVLTSDGIHDYITKPFFERTLTIENDLENIADTLIKKAIDGESADNLTIIVLKVGE